MVPNAITFVKDGPALPLELLRRLEDGGLTIFAGAGVSRRLNLPDFEGLVTEVCKRLRRQMDADEQELCDRQSFDAALGLMESRIPEGEVRAAVRDVLTVPPDADLGTHAALLKLATSKEGRLRLVTTNFDDAFEQAPYSRQRASDYAPYLPVPGAEWDSIVHLHGGLGNPRDPAGTRLVLTSADFGRAYITEGWASKFLAELFRRSTGILFVGYSVSDPAIRYIIDAFAADRGNKDSHVAAAYILIEAGPVQNARTWRSRGVEAIVYDPRDNHGLLHETLRRCADRYATGLFDRASIIHEHGTREPLAAFDQEAVSQMLWALNEPSGYAARRFSEMSPSAPIAWLDNFERGGLFGLTTPTGHRTRALGDPALHCSVRRFCARFYAGF